MKTKTGFPGATARIFIGLILGIILGFLMPGRFDGLLPTLNLVSGVYMNALRMMIYPLVFCSLIVGIHSIGSVSATGKIGLQSILYFTVTTLFASLLGLFLPQMLGLGNGVTITMMDATVTATEFTSLLDTVRDLIPANPIASFAALAAIAGLPSGIMGTYISINTLCDMGATCANVLGDLACAVAMKETVKK